MDSMASCYVTFLHTSLRFAGHDWGLDGLPALHSTYVARGDAAKDDMLLMLGGCVSFLRGAKVFDAAERVFGRLCVSARWEGF
jgi:hypothetical protein